MKNIYYYKVCYKLKIINQLANSDDGWECKTCENLINIHGHVIIS